MPLDILEERHLQEYKKYRDELGGYGFMTGDCNRTEEDIQYQNVIGYRCEVLDGLIEALEKKANEQ